MEQWSTRPAPQSLHTGAALGGHRPLSPNRSAPSGQAALEHRDRLTPDIKRAYLAPNPTAASRTGVLVFLQEIPTGPSDPISHLRGELEDGLERHFRDKPVGIAWGMKDAAFTPAYLELWLGTFPHAVVTRVPDAGHFVQEDAYERVVPALLDHLRNARSAPAPRPPS